MYTSLRGYVRLWLVVIKVAYKIVHGAVWEEVPELGIQLGRQRLVVAQHQRRPLQILNNVSHGKCLARARYAQ